MYSCTERSSDGEGGVTIVQGDGKLEVYGLGEGREPGKVTQRRAEHVVPRNPGSRVCTEPNAGVGFGVVSEFSWVCFPI